MKVEAYILKEIVRSESEEKAWIRLDANDAAWSWNKQDSKTLVNTGGHTHTLQVKQAFLIVFQALRRFSCTFPLPVSNLAENWH